MRRTRFRLTLAAALVAATIPASNALAQQSASCQRLLAMVDEADGEVDAEFRDARSVGETDDPNQCSVYVARVVAVGGLMGNTADADTLNAADTETTTETVEIERQATIEGEVKVTMPDPQVRVEQDAAEIAVRTPTPEVTVSQGQPTITVRQAQPIITVRMAQPTITVEQPAPEIVITMPQPGVNVASAQPTIEVNIPEPRVTVTQGQPSLAVDLDTNVGGEVADSSTRLERSDDADGNMVVTANGLSSGPGEPRIEYVQSEEEPKITYDGVEPQVEYVAAEAEVRIESEGEPVIEMVDGGEPKIMIRQDGESDGAAVDTEQPDAVAALAPADAEPTSGDGQRDPREAFAAAGDATLESGENGVVTVGELAGMEVKNARNEDLGEVDRVVRNGNGTYVIVEHGGWFFGLNDKEIALPIDDVTIRGEEIVLRGLTEEQIESMPDYDYGNEIALEQADEIMLRRLN